MTYQGLSPDIDLEDAHEVEMAFCDYHSDIADAERLVSRDIFIWKARARLMEKLGCKIPAFLVEPVG